MEEQTMPEQLTDHERRQRQYDALADLGVGRDDEDPEPIRALIKEVRTELAERRRSRGLGVDGVGRTATTQ